jgi:AcrR family transcriptional regulator/DNA-binding MarR family transcriptional regulator
VEVQRARVINAAIDVISELGYGQATVEQVTGRAGVSRKTFYDLFDDREDCAAAAFQQAISEARALARATYSGESAWLAGIRAALHALLLAMDEKPGLTRLCLVEIFYAGEKAMCHRAEVAHEIASAIDRARTLEGSREPAELTAEGIVGAIFAVLHKRTLMRKSDAQPMVDLLGPLMSMIVLPYFGSRAASRELSRRPPQAQPASQQPQVARKSNPLEGLNMRLTYRTLRVLVAIGAQPAISNRDLAAAAGVSDQGQISKLMSRLERLGLAENRGKGQKGGAPNAWHLTPLGAELERVAAPQKLLRSHDA